MTAEMQKPFRFRTNDDDNHIGGTDDENDCENNVDVEVTDESGCSNEDGLGAGDCDDDSSQRFVLRELASIFPMSRLMR